ncbi:predicted protein [Coccidioides posadasii str. Silveira]|uniref:Predicted protein n=1 Tax=Coccidioides posadasii (strain RMSCC 757 / Silveira) TaxID=443226 RepID=E9DJ01_COCPS|nr:predicted protein [Coccidioides posadasii str. Silveira]
MALFHRNQDCRRCTYYIGSFALKALFCSRAIIFHICHIQIILEPDLDINLLRRLVNDLFCCMTLSTMYRSYKSYLYKLMFIPESRLESSRIVGPEIRILELQSQRCL